MEKFYLMILASLLANAVIAQTGKIGINTNTPQAMLHVKDSSVLFTGAASLPASAGNPPASGSGIRMMWYADKAAFRAGIAGAFNWNKDSIGNNSFATGNSTKAKGNNSMATGLFTAAIGSEASASGYSTIAGGVSSFATGELSTATGDYSFAACYNNIATGIGSAGLGGTSQATGSYSLATGFDTRADGVHSSSFGFGTISRSADCLVAGIFNDTTTMINTITQTYAQPLFVVGNGLSNNNRQNALTVMGNGRVGIGSKNPKATLQLFNQEPGDAHIAMTPFFTSNDTGFIRYDDRRMQFRNANSFGSFWEFQNHSGNRQVLISSNGDIDMNGGWTTGDGCSINATEKLAGLYIKAINGTFDQHIRLESTLGVASYANILYDGSLKFRTFDATATFQWRDNTNNTRMILTNTGNLTIDGILTQSSDERLKTGIMKLVNPLVKLQEISGYHYYWKDSSRSEALQTGLLAQELEKAMPELVKANEEGDKTVNYIGLIPYLIEANKELLKRVEALEKQIVLLRKE